MRKTYSKEFKIDVCKSIVSKETTVSKVAKDYGISRPIASRWLSEYKRYGNNAFSGKGNRLPDKAKLYALEKENKLLKEELEILKKFEEFVKKSQK